MQSYDIALDMKKAAGRIERTVVVRRGDNDTQQVRASITAGGQPYTPKGTARLDILHADGTWARCSASVSGSTAACTLPSAALNGAGRCRAAHFVFTDGAKVESTEGFALVIEGNVDTDGTPGAQGYDDALNALNDRLQKAEAERAKAEQGRVAAEQGRANAEKARADAEAQRAAKEAERVEAERARASAETARADAESKRAQAEQARASEEGKRATAETERKKAEDGRKSAETARASEESKRATAEDARKQAETGRASAEDARKQAEAARANAEAARASEESKRAQAETKRGEAETARAEAEQSRASKEAERIAAEAARAEAERARVAAEQSRSTAETARAEAERARADAQAKNDADQALNNEQMKKLSPVILQEGQYDRATLKPTIEGEPNRMYFVPMVAPAAMELYGLTQKQVEAGNLYVEWMWVGGKWEQMGQSEMKARPISTEQVDAVFAGEHPTGEDVLNLTGLDYFKGRADAAYAPTCFRGTLSSGDLNSITAPGAYKIDGVASIRNFPSGAYAWGILEVSACGEDGADAVQTYTAHYVSGSGGVYVRALYGGSWRAWQHVEMTGHKHGAGDITSGTLHVDRVPELPIAKVNGLQGALDGKQPKGEYAAMAHRHDASDIDGLDAAAGGVRVVRTEKFYPDGWNDRHGFYVRLKDQSDPMYPAYLASQGVVVFQSGLAMWTIGSVLSSGIIYLTEPVCGCAAKFRCRGSGSEGNGGALEVQDGGLLTRYRLYSEATIDEATIDGHAYRNVPLSGFGMCPLGVFVEQSSSPQTWCALSLRLPGSTFDSGTGKTSLTAEQAESGVFGVCYGDSEGLNRRWEADSWLSVRFVKKL